MTFSNQDKHSDGKSLLPHYRQSGPFSRLDIVLLVILLVVAAGAAVFAYAGRPAGERVEIYHEGNLVGSYPLSEDKHLEYEGGIVVEIKDGAAAITESDCPDLLCVRTGAISKAGERAVCAPNKFVIVIRGRSGYDAVTGRSTREK